MAFRHRKTPNITRDSSVVYIGSCSPPPLPPPPQSFNHSFPPFLIIMFGGLAFSLCFICYLTCAIRYRTRRTNHQMDTNEPTHEDIVNEDLGPLTFNPIWLINTRGLDPSQIESIQVFKYKRDEKLIEGTDCSVCLSEFEDDESLRLLPKCSHAFHVPCIDTWLRSHTNCPLCRAPIVKNTNDQTENTVVQTNSIESSSASVEMETEAQVNDSETIDDHHVVEVENSEETVKTFSVVDETSSRVRVHGDLADLDRVRGEGLAAMRRSFSNGQLAAWKKLRSASKRENKLKLKLKESSSSIHVCHKEMKSSSFRCSLRKASSFTSKSRPHNRSY